MYVRSRGRESRGGGGAGDVRQQVSDMKTMQCTNVWTCEVIVLSDPDVASRDTDLLTSELFAVLDILTHQASWDKTNV